MSKEKRSWLLKKEKRVKKRSETERGRKIGKFL